MCAQKSSVLRTKDPSFLLITDGVLKINVSSTRKELDSPILRLISLHLFSLSHRTLMPKHSKEVLWGLLFTFTEVLGSILKNAVVCRYLMGKYFRDLDVFKADPWHFPKKNKALQGWHFPENWEFISDRQNQ